MSSEGGKAVGIATVTSERKKELLLEARKTRITWIQSSSFPFLEERSSSLSTTLENGCGSNTNHGTNDNEMVENKVDTTTNVDDNVHSNNDDDGMKVIRDVCQEVNLPSAVPIIDLLLDKTKDTNLRLHEQQSLPPTTMSTAQDLSHKLQSKLQLLEKTQNENNNCDSDADGNGNKNNPLSSYEISMDSFMDKTDDHLFLFYYKDVLEKLCLPECADIVQGMRHFERSFQELATQLQGQIKEQQQQQPGVKEEQFKSKENRRQRINSVADEKGEKKDDNITTTATTKTKSTKNNDTANEHLDTIAKGLQKYISKLYDSLTSHIAWRDNVISSETKMMLETFIYAKCHVHIQPILSMVVVDTNQDEDGDNDDRENSTKQQRQVIRVCDDEAMMQKRLEFLQFVGPKHLDMHAFVSSNTKEEGEDNGTEEDEDENNNENDVVDNLPWQSKLDLSKPISHVKSLDIMYSPAQMLRCILEIYRCVNESLNESLQTTTSSGSPNVSADDVLPSLILSVIHAKPKRIMTNLTFLEKFASDEQIRGEAGYAFTNLFSAVQFIKELDLQLDNHNLMNEKLIEDEDQSNAKSKRGRPTLSMSATLLRKKMREFQAEWKSREESKLQVEKKEDKLEQPSDADDCKEPTTPNDEDCKIEELKRIEIPTHEVKAARLRGDDINDWASRWFDAQVAVMKRDNENGQSENTDQSERSTTLEVSPVEGFSRSYSFLTTDSKDVKVSDIPELLKEYKMLVRTTETLLMERNALIQQGKQKEVATKRDKLENSLETMMNKS